MVSQRLRIKQRSIEIRTGLEHELRILEKPITLKGLVDKLKSNRITVSRMLLECIQSDKFPISIVRRGGYDIVYRTSCSTCHGKFESESVDNAEKGTQMLEE